MTENDVTERALRALRRILRGTTDFSRQLARNSGLTVPQVLCLQAIAGGEGGEVTVVSVAQAVGLAPATVSRILDRLEQAGLVTRHRRSRDRRKVCLELTAAARAQIAELPVLPQQRFAERLSALSEAKQRSLLRSLETVVDMLEAGGLDASPVLDAEPNLHTPPEQP